MLCPKCKSPMRERSLEWNRPERKPQFFKCAGCDLPWYVWVTGGLVSATISYDDYEERRRTWSGHQDDLVKRIFAEQRRHR